VLSNQSISSRCAFAKFFDCFTLPKHHRQRYLLKSLCNICSAYAICLPQCRFVRRQGKAKELAFQYLISMAAQADPARFCIQLHFWRCSPVHSHAIARRAHDGEVARRCKHFSAKFQKLIRVLSLHCPFFMRGHEARQSRMEIFECKLNHLNSLRRLLTRLVVLVRGAQCQRPQVSNELFRVHRKDVYANPFCEFFHLALDSFGCLRQLF
jgi:hypothetical protein